MKVIAIDPGEKVGWAIAETFDAAIQVLDYGISQLKPFAVKWLGSAPGYDVMIYEEYRIRPDMLRAHAGSNVPTLQLVGMVRLGAWAAQAKGNGFQPQIVSQPPTALPKGAGLAKLYFPEYIQAAIEEADAGPHDDGHHSSALKHLAVWFHHHTEAS